MEGLKNNRFKSFENFRSNQTVKANKDESHKVQVAPDDMYMKWPLRGLAYTNEIGEIIRPMNSLAANLLWLPAICYISADVADKYKHNPNGETEPSKKRAGKQFSFQMLASVILPTAAVKVGQKLTNVMSSKGKIKLSFNEREKLTNMITNSMDKGTHEKFVDAATGKVNRAEYTQHIIDNIASMDRHEETKNSMFKPLERVVDFIKKPFKTKPNAEAVKAYVETTVDNVMDVREALLEGKQPSKISKGLFKEFQKASKDADIVQKKSAAFNIIKKMQANKLFKNNALKSLGGLVALSIMMKPIDNFVENVLIEKYIGPTIDRLQKPWKSLDEVAKEKNQLAAQK